MQRINDFDEYKRTYQYSISEPEAFWSDIAEEFVWDKKWDTLLEQDWGHARTTWFKGGVLNITTNCLDRHVKKNAEKTAITWVPNDPIGQVQSITY